MSNGRVCRTAPVTSGLLNTSVTRAFLHQPCFCGQYGVFYPRLRCAGAVGRIPTAAGQQEGSFIALLLPNFFHVSAPAFLLPSVSFTTALLLSLLHCFFTAPLFPSLCICSFTAPLLPSLLICFLHCSLYSFTDLLILSLLFLFFLFSCVP